MYKISKSNSIIRLTDKAVIPLDINNTDYQQYIEWILSGNIPEQAEQDVLEDIVVSPWQFRKALNQLNLRDAVEALVSNSSNRDIHDGWEFATEVRRSDPLVIGMAYMLNLSDEDLTSIFKLALEK